MNSNPKYYLPGVLSEIAEHIGQDVAVKLCLARGGREVWVPEKPKAGDVLSKIIGLHAAKLLSKLKGAGNMPVPQGNLRGEGGRRLRILDLHEQGLSQSNIAAEVDVSLRTVERVLAGRANPNQPKLPF